MFCLFGFSPQRRCVCLKYFIFRSENLFFAVFGGCSGGLGGGDTMGCLGFPNRKGLGCTLF